MLNDPSYIVGSGATTRVAIGCLLDVINALACVGTAVTVYPAVRRHNESLALGFVTSRMFEAAVIFVGVVSLLGVVTLRQDFSDGLLTDRSGLVTAGHALVAVTGRSSSGRTCAQPSTRCCSARCCTARG